MDWRISVLLFSFVGAVSGLRKFLPSLGCPCRLAVVQLVSRAERPQATRGASGLRALTWSILAQGGLTRSRQSCKTCLREVLVPACVLQGIWQTRECFNLCA